MKQYYLLLLIFLLPMYTFGQGNALDFDGTNDYVSLPNVLPTAITNNGTATALTIEYWFKGSTMQSVVRLQVGGKYIVSGWYGKHIISTDGGTTGISAGNTVDGNWHHVAMTWEKNTTNGFRSYVDGVLVDQRDAANVNLPNITTTMSLGSLYGVSEFMNGELDEVRIWNDVRTPTEITNNMFITLNGTEPNLVAYYSFDNVTTCNGTSNEIQDESINTYHGTSNGMDNGDIVVSTAITPVYVNINAAGNNNGSSWANAYTDLQDAIDAASVNDEIWVAAGTYLPTKDHTGNSSPSNNRDKTFHLGTDMKIYGGFNGTETLSSQRNAATNITILSGDFNDDDIVTGGGSTLSISGNTENAYHVMITANLTSASVIEGFTVKDGNANVSSSITYQSETFYRKYGGGMLNASSFPTITNATFVNNSADYGGGMYNLSSSPTITNATFEYNKTNSQGGGMYNRSSAPVIINTIFSNNRTTALGGGMYNSYSSPTITNATFEDNSSRTPGGGMRNYYSSPIITNTIFWNNKKGGSNNVEGADIENSNSTPTVTYCLTQANSTYSSGTGIINNQDPLFVNAANGDYSLSGCSPAINAGTTVSHTTDMLGNTHVGIVDMGAYEFQGTPYNYTHAIYVNVNAAGNNDGSTWTNAYTDLQDAIDNQCGGLDIWVAAGTYLPTKDHTGNSSPSNNRDKTFHLGTDMKIYGGFDGTETLLSQRNAATNITILSGDFNDNDVVTGGGSTLSISGNTEMLTM